MQRLVDMSKCLQFVVCLVIHKKWKSWRLGFTKQTCRSKL